VNVAAGQYILMLKIAERSLDFVDAYMASSSNINCMFEKDKMIVFGCVDGSVELVTVSYPTIGKNMDPVIISGSVLSGIVLFGLVIAIYKIITHNS
jgi:hypothetical protein